MSKPNPPPDDPLDLAGWGFVLRCRPEAMVVSAATKPLSNQQLPSLIEGGS
jgi:hypothetical protein